MKATEIIRKDMARNGMSADEQRFLDGLAEVIKQKKATLLQSGDTVLIIFRRSEDTAEVLMFTQDTMQNIAKAMKAFYAKVRGQGIKKAVAESVRPAIAEIAKASGIPMQATKNGANVRLEMEIR